MKINIATESQRFLDFMNEENNNNIIFSGIYGIGKSYFINNFFNEKHEGKYFTLFITPVNYSVASNEDIFEYIKADILLQLLEKSDCNLIDIDISSSVAAFYYIKNNLNDIIANIFSVAEKICFNTDIFSQLLALKQKIQQFQKDNSISENKEIESFINEITQKKGSIYESNFITQIIQSIITKIKTEKEVVLVIDDLDRIDPEHIFRILNVLSAHEDFGGIKEHKFNIDKTILVCDIENVRKIFHSRYGADVDFSGYIDKFYSKEIFHFDNLTEIVSCITTQIFHFKEDLGYAIQNRITENCFIFILKSLIKYNLINIRTLEKMQFDYCINNKIVKLKGERFVTINSPSLVIFELLRRVIGSKDLLKSMLLRLSYNKVGTTSDDYIIVAFVILADLENNNLKKGISFNYKGIEYSIGSLDKSLIIDTNRLSFSSDNINCFEILYEAYLNYQLYATL